MKETYAERLRSLLHQANLPSLKALCQAANVTEWQVRQLRRGQAAKMRVEALHPLSQALGVSLAELVAQFSDLPVSSPPSSPQSEPDFQQASLQILESWLVQYPTAAYAAQQNPDLPAARLLPLIRPVEQLIKSWEVESIAPVGSERPYDPQWHQLMEGTAEVGDRVRIRYAGYRQGDRLLHRAKVSPVIAPLN
jgi:transcriptional regulator with XRE-family HTH domain